MLRPGATGMRISGTGRPRISKNASSSPSRSYSRVGTQRSSWTTSSTRFDDRVEAMPDNQVERALALADAALAGDEDAEAEDVHEHGVHHGALGERILENRRQLGDRGRRDDGGFEQRDTRPLGLGRQLDRRNEAAGNQHARKIQRQREPQRGDPRGGVEAFEIADFTLAEDQHPARLEVFVEAGERQAGLLDVRAGDDAIEPVAAGEQFERQAEGVGPAREQRRHRHAGGYWHVSEPAGAWR
jgi:hypothetical protein